MHQPFAGVTGMVPLLMISPGFNDSGLFKVNLYEIFNLYNATFVDPSSSVCDMINPKTLLNIAHLAWVKYALAPVLRWSHRHGAAIDDSTRF